MTDPGVSRPRLLIFGAPIRKRNFAGKLTSRGLPFEERRRIERERERDSAIGWDAMSGEDGDDLGDKYSISFSPQYWIKFRKR